jgi:sialic acid synthase
MHSLQNSQPSLKFLLDMDVPFIKIGSGDSEDFVLLREAAASKRPLVISTGKH